MRGSPLASPAHTVRNHVKPTRARRHLVQLVLFFAIALAVAQQGAGGEQRMSLDVKDTDIRDAIRMISKGYDINIILDKDISGKVTVHLSEVPIMEGLTTLAESNGLEVVREGSVYRIRRWSFRDRSIILFL